MPKKALINYMQHPQNDEIYTRGYAVKPLIKYLPKNITIWECTDYGNSNITKELLNAGFKVISTKKEDFNFLRDKPNFDFDMIITNPPYSIKDEFIEKCYEYGKPFCLLLPLTALEGIKRGNMFRKNGIEVLVFDKRCNFIYGNNKKNNWFNTSWFCHKVLPKQLMFEKLIDEE